MARAIGETAPIITIGALTFIAFLPPVPFTGEPAAGLFDWLFSPVHGDADPDLQLDLAPRPAFHQNAAAASFVLVVMTLGMNALAIWLRYRLRKNIKW
jgi:phosphate transport system permease protein